MTPAREAALLKTIEEYEALVLNAKRYEKLRYVGFYLASDKFVVEKMVDEYADKLPEARHG